MDGYQIKQWPTHDLTKERARQRILNLSLNVFLILLASFYFGLCGAIITYSGINSQSRQHALYELEHYVRQRNEQMKVNTDSDTGNDRFPIRLRAGRWPNN